MSLKIDVSILQAGALVGAIGLGAAAACSGQWGIAASAITGLFALLGIRRNDATAQPPAQTQGQPAP
jgi:hypothetical protein